MQGYLKYFPQYVVTIAFSSSSNTIPFGAWFDGRKKRIVSVF